MRKQLPQLSKMSNEAKDDLIRELWEEIQNLRAKLKELEEGKVKKTSKNSSIPPSKESLFNSEVHQNLKSIHRILQKEFDSQDIF